MTNPEEPTTDATKVTDAPNVSSSAEEKDGDTVFFEDLYPVSYTHLTLTTILRV